MQDKRIIIKKGIIRLTIIFILFIIIMPVEQWIFRFKTPEEALKFDYTAKVEKILGKVEIENYAYIIYINNSGEWTNKYVCKDKRGWISPIKKHIISNKSEREWNYHIISYKENGEYILKIDSSASSVRETIGSISDNIGTEFKSVTYEYNGFYCKSWLGIVKKYPENYKIYLDSNEINL